MSLFAGTYNTKLFTVYLMSCYKDDQQSSITNQFVIKIYIQSSAKVISFRLTICLLKQKLKLNLFHIISLVSVRLFFLFCFQLSRVLKKIFLLNTIRLKNENK